MSKAGARHFIKIAVSMVETGESEGDVLLTLIEAASEAVNARRKAATQHILTAMHDAFTGTDEDIIDSLARAERALR